jgi:hypothetical protein
MNQNKEIERLGSPEAEEVSDLLLTRLMGYPLNVNRGRHFA